jgi:hypothetical protein
MVRWMGVGLAVPLLVLAATELSCLEGDRLGSAAGNGTSALVGPPAPIDLPVQFEVDHPAPAAGPVLTR